MSKNDDEELYVKSRRGNWSAAGIPHKGWSCTHVDDLGEPTQICDMCEASQVRYVHYMKHPKLEKEFAVGRVCASHMEGNYTAANAREKMMRNRAVKKKRWLTRKWKTSNKGNPFIKDDGYVVSIFPKDKGWCYSMKVDGSDKPIYSKAYDSEEQAKFAAFDHITKSLLDTK